LRLAARAQRRKESWMENFGYLFAAYSIIFAAIFLYVVFIQRRQASLEQELRAMESRLGEMLSHPQKHPAPHGEHSPA
jgi:CcmD family protein